MPPLPAQNIVLDEDKIVLESQQFTILLLLYSRKIRLKQLKKKNVPVYTRVINTFFENMYFLNFVTLHRIKHSKFTI